MNRTGQVVALVMDMINVTLRAVSYTKGEKIVNEIEYFGD